MTEGLTTTFLEGIKAPPMMESGGMGGRYGDVIEAYRGLLLNQALALLGNPSDAEDVVQETFCEAFRDRARLAQVRSMGAWLRTINRANALTRRQKRKQEEREGNARTHARSQTTGGFSLIEVREEVARAIEKLPTLQRTAVILRYWEHRSCDEIAARLKLPPGTARRILCEAAEALHEKLKSYWQRPASGPAGAGEIPREQAGGEAP